MTNSIKRLIIVRTLLVVLCLTLFSLVIAVVQIKTDKHTPVAKIQKTASQIPTLRPTLTLTPTETLVPTLTYTPEPTKDLDKENYLARAKQVSTDCAKAIIDFGEQNDIAGRDITVLSDRTWITMTAFAISDMKVSCVIIAKSMGTVPAGYEEYNHYITMMADEMDQMIVDYTYGIDHLDANRIFTANDHLTKAKEYNKKALEVFPPN